MSATDSSDNKRVLYLEQIDVETQTRTRLRIKLQNNGNDVEIEQKAGISSWIPSRSLEILSVSKVSINARSKHNPFSKSETLAEVSGEDAMQAFWDSKESLSLSAAFDHQPAIITLHFRPSHTSETIRAAVQNLETSMEGYKSLMKGSTEHRIDAVINLGTIIAEMDPFAKLGFGLAKGIFDLLKEQRKYDENVSDLASGVDGLLPFANRALEGVLYEEVLLDVVVGKLYELAGDTATFVIGYAKRGPAMRALRSAIYPNDHDKIQALREEFRKVKEDFDRALNVEALTGVRRLEESGLLKRLEPVEAANYDEDRVCMEGTRTAILDEITAWAELQFNCKTSSNDPSRNVFWLYGMPGLGKTSVASSLCDRLRKNGNLGGSFFCKHDNPDLREPKRVLPTLIAELVQIWGPFRRLVAKTLHDEPQIKPKSTHGELLLKALKALKKSPPCPFVLVIDALDECGRPSDRGSLLNSLIEACSLVNWLKVVITSRPERDIKSFFDEHPPTGRDLAADDVEAKDIRFFTENRMAIVANGRHLPPDWPGTERITKIVERARGLFVFVDTLSRLLDVLNPEPLLVEVLSGKLEEANTELHKLYSTAIESRVSRHTKEFHSLLRAVVAVSKFRPLCAETLAHLIGMEVPTVLSWLDELSSLLYQDVAEGNEIRVRHLSFLEFLVGSTCPHDIRVDQKLANSEATHRCLVTMVNELKFNICDLETSCLANADIPELNNRIKGRISDALQYSCMYWANHLCYDLDPLTPENTKLLDNFFAHSQALYWLEILSLMGRVPIAVSALRLIKAHLKKFENRHQCLVEDALRLVLAFFSPISTSSPHIYISALPFLPVESDLWKRANASFPNIIHVSKGRMECWPAPPITWLGHTGFVNSVAHAPDGQSVVSGSDDRTIRIWDAQTGAAVGQPLEGHTGCVYSVAYSPDGLSIISGSSDNTIRIWDAQTGAAVGQPLQGHTDWVHSVAYSPDGRNIISGSLDNTIRIWDAQTGATVGKPLHGHTSYVYSVAYSPDGRNIISGSSDDMIRIWDAQTGAAVGQPLQGHTGYVHSAAYSPDGRKIISGSKDNTIRIWDAQTGVVVGQPLQGHTGCVRSVAYSPDGQNIISGSEDTTIRIWNVQTGAMVGQPLQGHTNWVHSVAYSPNGRNIISGSFDSTIRIWDAQTGETVGQPLQGHTGSVYSVTYSPDGQSVVCSSTDNTVRILDAQTGAAVGQPLQGHTAHISSVACSPNGRNIISGSWDNTIRIWDAQTGETVGQPLQGHTGYVCSVAYSPDGQNIISGSSDNTIRIWNVQTGAVLGQPLQGHTNWVHSVAYSPNGRNIISGSFDRTIRIWDAQTGETVGKSLQGHTGAVYSVAYSPDGRNIISGSSDSTIRIWDVQTGAAVGRPLNGHTRYVYSLAYSPDGRNIISGSEDNTIRIWDAQTGATVGQPLQGHTGCVYSVAYSPNGRNIISGSEDNTMRIWEVDSEILENDAVSLPSHSPNGYLALAAFSGRPILKGHLGSDGWVRGEEGLLFWVPEDCRNGLTSPALMAIPNTGRQRCVRLDFGRFQYGASWTNIRG